MECPFHPTVNLCLKCKNLILVIVTVSKIEVPLMTPGWREETTELEKQPNNTNCSAIWNLFGISVQKAFLKRATDLVGFYSSKILSPVFERRELLEL